MWYVVKLKGATDLAYLKKPVLPQLRNILVPKKKEKDISPKHTFLFHKVAGPSLSRVLHKHRVHNGSSFLRSTSKSI